MQKFKLALIGILILTGLIGIGLKFFMPSASSPPQASPSPNQTSYTCPTSEYINCMPQIVDDSEISKQLSNQQQKICSNDYISWASKNCPGFKGATY